MDMALSGKVAVVTGGIGEAICRGLAGAGCAVMVGYNHSKETARVLADDLLP